MLNAIIVHNILALAFSRYEITFYVMQTEIWLGVDYKFQIQFYPHNTKPKSESFLIIRQTNYHSSFIEHNILSFNQVVSIPQLQK